ncbi:DNA-binding protein [Lactococcus petauri]|uniref:DNA-binding protein n=1 Tax=Lactococcus petauri TaxID=1940789 RepID=UPI001F06ADD4|nr:DNA-binding protein [Lactococcus petauri]MCH1712936.1 DNA-binding protein [Lactococcus petauri]
MERDLTQSSIERQIVLNNPFALEKAQKEFNLEGMYFTNQQIADFYEVSLPTIERAISENQDELKANGLKIVTGQELNDLISNQFVTIKNDGRKLRNLTISTVRGVLNFGMLLKNSDKARFVRSRILDIAMSSISEKTTGNTKYINQNDKDYLTSAQVESVERKNFTDALNHYVDMNNYKYAYFTNAVYKAIFKERAQEYKKLLNLDKKENARHTMYSEVLLSIASFEAGLAYEIENKSNECGRKLTKVETDDIIERFSAHPAQKPHVNKAREKMYNRDDTLRDIQHEKISDYRTAMSEEDYNLTLKVSPYPYKLTVIKPL